MYCPNCGTKNPVNINFCPNCGFNLREFIDSNKVEPNKGNDDNYKVTMEQDRDVESPTRDENRIIEEEIKEASLEKDIDEKPIIRSFEELAREERLSSQKESHKGKDLSKPIDIEEVFEIVHPKTEDRFRQEREEEFIHIAQTFDNQDFPHEEESFFNGDFTKDTRNLENDKDEKIHVIDDSPKEEEDLGHTRKWNAEDLKAGNFVDESQEKDNKKDNISIDISGITKMFVGWMDRFSQFTEKYMGKFMDDAKLQNIVLILFGLTSVVSVVGYMRLFFGSAGTISLLTMILILVIADAFGNFLQHVGGFKAYQWFIGDFEDRNIIFYYSLVFATINSIIRAVLAVGTNSLIGTDMYFRGKIFGAHPVISIVMILLSVLLICAILWKRTPQERRLKLVGAVSVGVMVSYIGFYLVGATIVRMITGLVLPFLING